MQPDAQTLDGFGHGLRSALTVPPNCGPALTTENMQSGRKLAINYLLLIGFLATQISLFGCGTTNASDLIRQQRIEQSPQWNGEAFQNPEQVPGVEWGPSLKMFWNYFF
ncbi:MAG: hypothetical protein OEQ39_27995, partial [Gammaproteobacteria bacterium]|nr:hypothetical protein [Gammaproteobacteria bacterium]